MPANARMHLKKAAGTVVGRRPVVARVFSGDPRSV